MRRKPVVADAVAQASGVDVASLRPCPPDDRSLPYRERRKVSRAWLAERAEWVARREAFAAEHGWPGGDRARLAEEEAAHPIRDAPFDVEWEVANGHL